LLQGKYIEPNVVRHIDEKIVFVSTNAVPVEKKGRGILQFFVLFLAVGDAFWFYVNSWGRTCQFPFVERRERISRPEERQARASPGGEVAARRADGRVFLRHFHPSVTLFA